MAGDRYFINDPFGTHFLTLTIVDWVDLFSRPVYKSIITESLTYCTQHKGLVIYGWVLMSNHLHLLARTEPPHTLSAFLRDFKKFTSKQITAAIETQPESRRKWLLDRFSFEAKRSRRAEIYKVWKDDNHAMQCHTETFFRQKLTYLHTNPVRQGIVLEADHYLYSSAVDYSGMKGLVPVIVA